MDIDAKAWLNITTDAANDTTKWFERDLDDFLKEIHRETEENEKDEEDYEKLRQIVDVNARIWNHTIKMMEDFDKCVWNFDVFKYYETLGDASLLHFGFRIF